MNNLTSFEITVRSLILGVLLSIVLAGANAYLGLFAGMTVSASIPAAVISMAILRLFRNSNIYENNIVQTAASAGEALAAGVIFTVPALVLLGYWQSFDYFQTARIAIIGGVVGVLFTVPLRRALIVEAGLAFPEGVATAEVLKTGSRSGDAHDEPSGGIAILVRSALIGGLMKLAQQGMGMWKSAIQGGAALHLGGRRNALFGFGLDISPALVGVGYIIGRNIAVLIFMGGAISWLIAIPIFTLIHGGFEHAGIEQAYAVWNQKIRYLGVGAMVVGGIWSITRLSEPLMRGIHSSIDSYRKLRSGGDIVKQDMDIPILWVFIGVALSVIPVFFLYSDILESPGTALLIASVMLVFGFLFSAVAGYMAGLVGSSNNPISGVTIATILFSSLLLLAILGTGSLRGAAGAVIIGAVVCCAASIAGDNMQDLKTGYIIGATPWKQQVMQIVGTVSAATTLGITLQILHTVYGIGSETLPAPQATLMSSVADGVFRGDLPWMFVGAGAMIGIIIISIDLALERRSSSFRMPVLAVAVGIYLPISLSAAIFVGGVIAHLVNRSASQESQQRRGMLFSSGLITGEALMGILVAVPIFLTADKNWWPRISGFSWAGAVLFLGVILWLYATTRRATSNNTPVP